MGGRERRKKLSSDQSGGRGIRHSPTSTTLYAQLKAGDDAKAANVWQVVLPSPALSIKVSATPTSHRRWNSIPQLGEVVSLRNGLGVPTAVLPTISAKVSKRDHPCKEP